MKKFKHFHGHFRSMKPMVFTVEVYLLCIIGFIVSVNSNLLPAPLARITVLNLERGHLRTVTNKVNHEVVLTVPTRYSEAYYFECNASYPIEWNYIGEGAPTTTADVGRHFKDFYDVNSYTYQSTLYMYNLEEFQTGRYICRGSNPEHDKLQIHYDLFVPGNGSRILLSTAEKELFVPESKQMTAIPCGVTDPTAIINLYKGNSWGTFQKLETNESIIFRPRKGFVLKMHELPDPYGTYMCTTQNNQKRRKIHLVPERLKSKYSNANHLNGKIPVQLTYDYEYNRVLCCTGTSFVPKLQWAGCASVLDCQIKSMCFEEDRCEGRLGASGSGDISTHWTDPGPLPKGCAGWKLRNDPNGDHGIFKCSTPGVSQYQPYLLNRGNIFLDFDKAPGSEMILSLTKIKDEPIYIGSEVEYHCNSTRFYFAFGIRWAFQRGNGDIEFVEDASVVKDRYFLTAHRRQTTFRILHADIKGIICFVPIANSPTEWRTVSLPISIKESFNILPVQHGHGRLPQKDYISNVIPYTAQPHLVEPYSTSRPKGYFNYQTDSDTQVPNIDLSEVISPKEKLDISSAPLPIEQPQILSESPDRDYNVQSYPKQTDNVNKLHSFIGPQIPSRLKNEHIPNENPYIISNEGRPDDDYPNPIHQSKPSYVPVNSNRDTFVDINPTRPQPPPPIPVDDLLPSYETEDRDYINQPDQKHLYTYDKPQSNYNQRHRKGYKKYSTTTKKPQGYYSYEVNENRPQISFKSIEEYKLIRTSPAPIPQSQSVIHYDPHAKGYSLRTPSENKDILRKHPKQPTHTHQIYEPKPDHSIRYETPTPSTHSFTDDHFASGSRPISKTILAPQQGTAMSQHNENDYYTASLRVKQQRRHRLRTTTMSPYYYNYNKTSSYDQPQSSSSQSSSWERAPLPLKASVEKYSRERDNYRHVPNPSSPEQQQYHKLRDTPPKASSRMAEDQSSSDVADENYYYQRYAAESKEFPANYQTRSRVKPRVRQYNDDNSIRRNGYIYSNSEVPMVELG